MAILQLVSVYSFQLCLSKNILSRVNSTDKVKKRCSKIVVKNLNRGKLAQFESSSKILLCLPVYNYRIVYYFYSWNH